MFEALDHGVTGRAMAQGQISLHHFNPRDFSDAADGRVDDRPFGGGPGMVMQVPPLRAAIKQARETLTHRPHVVYLSPQGQRLTQSTLVTWAQADRDLIFLAGRYEGIDERIVEADVDEECSIGDYVLSGGELAAMVCIDGLIRLKTGVLGNAASANADSFGEEGLLEHPQYTRPACVDGQAVPEILLSGHHEHIAQWRRQQALIRTYKRRPDLLTTAELSPQERAWLEQFSKI